MPMMPEQDIAEELRLLREELYSLRVLLTPELKKTELIQRSLQEDKERLAAIRRKSRG